MLNLHSIPLTFSDFTTWMCCSRGAYWKNSACHTYPSICYYYLNCIALESGDGELEMGWWSWDHLSPSILGTVLPQWTGLIGMQQGLSLSLPLAFLPVSLVLLSPKQTFWWKAEGVKIFRKARHMQEHTHNHRLRMCFCEGVDTNTQIRIQCRC